MCCSIFFFNDTATTEIYTLSLHDALPILRGGRLGVVVRPHADVRGEERGLALLLAAALDVVGDLGVLHPAADEDRKSTRLNSSHANISYAVFCLKKKNNIESLILFICKVL